MGNAPFYESGLKFSCRRCSACCRYDEGYVYLSENDIDKLAAHFKMNRKQFIKDYCRQVNRRYEETVLSLKERANKDCIFWDNASANAGAPALTGALVEKDGAGGCLVYDSRPLQCRTFPFWENIVISKAAWETAATGCPGMNKGSLYTKEEIDAFLEMHNSD